MFSKVNQLFKCINYNSWLVGRLRNINFLHSTVINRVSAEGAEVPAHTVYRVIEKVMSLRQEMVALTTCNIKCVILSFRHRFRGKHYVIS
jgi:hypothetical protein